MAQDEGPTDVARREHGLVQAAVSEWRAGSPMHVCVSAIRLGGNINGPDTSALLNTIVAIGWRLHSTAIGNLASGGYPFTMFAFERPQGGPP